MFGSEERIEQMRKREGRDRRGEIMRERREKFRELKRRIENVLKNYFRTYHSTTVPSYIQNGTVAVWKKKIGILPVPTFGCCALLGLNAKFSLHLAFRRPNANALGGCVVRACSL